MKAKGTRPEAERRKGEALVSRCEAKQRTVKGIAVKLSTEVETEAWKQAEGNTENGTRKAAERLEGEAGKGRSEG